MREISKEVKHTFDSFEGEEKTFQIKKMNALEGSVLLKFVGEKLLPLFSAVQDVFVPSEDEEITEEELTARRSEAIMKLIPQALESISEDELMRFEQKCLNTVEILLPAGWQPVMRGKNFGVEELEYDPIAALLLCYEVVEFNLSGFFGGKGLASFLPNRNI